MTNTTADSAKLNASQKTKGTAATADEKSTKGDEATSDRKPECTAVTTEEKPINDIEATSDSKTEGTAVTADSKSTGGDEATSVEEIDDNGLDTTDGKVDYSATDEPTHTPQVSDIVAKPGNSGLSNSSFFMKLPTEVRVMILEYALITSVEHIYLIKWEERLRFFDRKRAGRAINQIQNVSKQLRLESEYMEMKYHEVIASGPDFVELIRMEKGRLQRYVREVSVQPLTAPYFQYKNPDEFVLHPLIDMCMKFEQAKVHVQLHDWNFSGRGGRTLHTFLNLATVIMQALRGKGIWLFSAGSQMVAKWQRRRPVSELNAKGLLFFPSEKTFDEHRFRQLFTPIQGAARANIFQHFGANDLDALVVVVKKWYSSGL